MQLAGDMQDPLLALVVWEADHVVVLGVGCSLRRDMVAVAAAGRLVGACSHLSSAVVGCTWCSWWRQLPHFGVAVPVVWGGLSPCSFSGS